MVLLGGGAFAAGDQADPILPHGAGGPCTEEAWRDGKRYLWLIGLVVPSLAVVADTGFTVTGWTVWLWIGPILILVIVPLLDLLVGIDPTNPGPVVVDALEPVGESAKGWLPAAVLEPLTLTTWQMVATTISIGCIGGIGINTAHELGHQREKVERWLSKIALAQSGYGHFYIEHNRGQHVRVSTPEDPTSSLIVLALVPPLWRRVMDPRVVAHDGGDDVAVAECPGCGYRYEVEAGDEHEGFAAGMPWSQIPDDWSCPDCGVRDKVDFRVLADDLPAPDAAQP